MERTVSASHLVTYLYNPIDFYLEKKVLSAKESTEIEEELSEKLWNFGALRFRVFIRKKLLVKIK